MDENEVQWTDEAWARIDAMAQVRTDVTIGGETLVLCEAGPVN